MIQKVKNFLNDSKVKVIGLTSLISTMSVLAFAEGTPTPVGYDTVITGITSSISVTQIASMVGAILAGGIGFVLFWMGARKGTRALMGAITKGKIKI